MQTLAYGGKGLLWFTYWTPDDPSLKWSHAMLGPDGSRDPHFAMIQNINADLKSLGRELLHARSVSIEVTNNLTIGEFATGKQYVALIANRDYKKSVVVDLKGSKEIFDPAKGRWKNVHSTIVTIPPGGSVLSPPPPQLPTHTLINKYPAPASIAPHAET